MSLAEIRQSKGLSQRGLSDVSGLAQVQVCRMESGKSNPTLESICAYASAVGMPAFRVVAILCGEEKMIHKSYQNA